MSVRYRDQVGGHKPCVPILVMCYSVMLLINSCLWMMLVVMTCYTMSSVALIISMLVIMPCSVGDYFIGDM